MKEAVLTNAVFALLIFAIPLLALNAPANTVQPKPAQHAVVQEQNSDHASAPVQPPAVAPAADTTFLLRDVSGKLMRVSARDYSRGALAAEMPPTFHPEALKAQAVASRTYLTAYAAGQEGEEAALEVDVQAWKGYTTEKQFFERYGNLAPAYWQAICEAADETLPFILTYEGEPIVAAYHSMSGGITEDAQNVWTGGKPYLVPVESRGDTLAPDYVSQVQFPVQEVAQRLRQAYPNVKLGQDAKTWLEVTERSQSGYVTKLLAGGQELHGKDLRELLQLRSSNFTIACDGSVFTFEVLGYGHGVGLSQYGADYMARQGASFDEILMHYYPGTTLTSFSQQT